jgi:tetrathionate reductase subunit B
MRYGMTIDLENCVRCRGCYINCKAGNKIPTQFDIPGKPARLWYDEHPVGKYPKVTMVFIPYHCMQCDDAPCIPVCPTGANQRTKDGIVNVDKAKCIGCKACVDACPYGARYLREDKNIADSCDFCMDRVAKGKKPFCVEKCTGSAMAFGDLDNPASDVAKKIAEDKAKPLVAKLAGTKPKVYYIVRKK